MTLLPEKTNNYIRVYDMLAMHGKPMHLNELAGRLGRRLSTVSSVLHVLLGQKRVERLAPALYIALPGMRPEYCWGKNQNSRNLPREDRDVEQPLQIQTAGIPRPVPGWRDLLNITEADDAAAEAMSND